jgi:DHA2 family multidrug resistance protein
MLFVVLDCGQRADWFASAWVRYFAMVSAGSIILPVFHELHFPDPILDLGMLKIFGFTLALILIAAQSLVLFSVNLLNPLFTQELLGYDAWQASLAAPRGIGVIVALIAVGSFRGAASICARCSASALFSSLVRSGGCRNGTPEVSTSAVLWPILLFGLGLGAVFPTVTAAAGAR